jgi:hypothetical protein
MRQIKRPATRFEQTLRQAVARRQISYALLAAAVCACVISLYAVPTESLLRRQTRDLAMAELCHGSGTIVGAVYATRRSSPYRNVSVRVAEGEGRISTTLPVRSGEVVKVSYRVGARGHVYIADIEPLND